MKVSILTASGEHQFETKSHSLLELLAENGIFINAYCGGRGLCRKCLVRYRKNPPTPTPLEKESIDSDRLQKGYRLACLHRLRENDAIEVFETAPAFAEDHIESLPSGKANRVALDIGTTTIVATLVDRSGRLLTLRSINPQVSFGADVISRISLYPEKPAIRRVLVNRIESMLDDLKMKAETKDVELLVVAANPTMLSFFLGVDPAPIGRYPYTVPFKSPMTTVFHNIKTYIPPVISAYVGSDIVCALASIAEKTKENFLLVDIGTNCEFLLKSTKGIFSASVPGGPALEGSGVDFGMMATEGAIESVEFDGTLKIKTIGAAPPVGISGTGLISAIALLRRYGLIDKSGRLLDPWEAEEAPLQLISRLDKKGFNLTGNIRITQRTISQFQLLRAALSAGIELLLTKTGFDMPEKVYVAGGFANALKKEILLDSGLLELEVDYEFIGNAAIKGALLLTEEGKRKHMEDLAKEIKYIEIANEPSFEELFTQRMSF